MPQSVPEKKALILTHGLALWDTIESCTITGASDASIRDVVPADIAGLARKAPIRRVLCNGATAYRLCEKYSRVPGLEAVKLPSTSPANAAWTMDKLAAAWETIWERRPRRTRAAVSAEKPGDPCRIARLFEYAGRQNRCFPWRRPCLCTALPLLKSLPAQKNRSLLGYSGSEVKAQAHFAQCAFVTGMQHAVLCISQSRSFGSAAMARAVSVLVAAVMESAASTSSTFKTLERLPRMSIFSLRIGSSMMGLMSVRESSMPAMALMALSTQEEQALIRLLALPVTIGPSGSWMAAAATPELSLLARAGATTARSAVVRESSCMMRLILSTASCEPLPCLWSQRAL